MPDIHGILFDVDETLFDRRRAQRLVLQRLPATLPALLGGLDATTLEGAWLRSDAETEDHVYTVPGDTRASRNLRSAAFLRLLGLPQDHADAVTDAYLELYPTVDAAIDGAAEVVSACAARLPVGVVSNAFPDVQYRKLETLGLRRHMGCIVLSEEYGGPRKPAPEIFRHGCQRLGTAPAATLYVGDSWGNDVVGAHGAGLIPCWFNPEGVAPPAGAGAPDWEIAHLREVPARLFAAS